MRRFLAGIALTMFAASGTNAHDVWLQPRGWQAVSGKPLPFHILVGHGALRQAWDTDASKVVALRDYGVGGSVDIRRLYRPAPGAAPFARSFRRPGAHVIALVSTQVQSDLPAIRFNDYLKAEGLTPAIDTRTRAGMTNANGRELYSRRAKALIQVGPVLPSDHAIVTRPVGMTLEIVPLRNPYALGANRALPVRILFEGRPLAGALVKLTNLDFDTRPLQSIRSDSDGKAVFQMPSVGSYLINVIWTKPVRAPNADFETTFSSLTFGFPTRRPR